MNPESNTAQSLIEAGVLALRKGDRHSARTFAQKAAVLAPQSEEPWLLLAYLATPKTAQNYLNRALRINPTSQRALAAQEWLKNKSGQSPQTGDASLPASLPSEKPSRSNTIERGKSRLPVLIIVLALVAGLSFLGFAARLSENQVPPLVETRQTLPGSSPTLDSSPLPSLTLTTAPTETSTPAPTTTSTPTPLPTDTATPLPSSTATPLPTETSTPTLEPTETQLPSPTTVKITNYKVQLGDTLSKIAQRYNVSIQNLMAANTIPNPSLIFAGQVLTIPNPGQIPVASLPTTVSNPGGSAGKAKEIQIDISEQHLYAYQEGKLVFSYVVSTGTGNSTRIGTFKVLDKIPIAYSSRFNIIMPWWMGIYYSGTLENGIHGLPLLYNGVELWGDMLGRPATYGCIEARTYEIKALYDWAEIGTTVIIRR